MSVFVKIDFSFLKYKKKFSVSKSAGFQLIFIGDMMMTKISNRSVVNIYN